MIILGKFSLMVLHEIASLTELYMEIAQRCNVYISSLRAGPSDYCYLALMYFDYGFPKMVLQSYNIVHGLNCFCSFDFSASIREVVGILR